MSPTPHSVLSQPPELNAFHQDTSSRVSVHLQIQYHFARATPSADDTPDASRLLCSGRILDHRYSFFFLSFLSRPTPASRPATARMPVINCILPRWRT